MTSNEALEAQIDPDLGTKAASGFAWSVLQTLGSKGVNLAGQLLLAWLLSPTDFGKIGLVYTVTALANILQQTGQREILVRRQSQLRRWLNPAMWLALSSGIAAALLMNMAAPLAARLYGSPGIVGLIFVFSFWSPISSLILVAQAVLETQMRFRLIAIITFTGTFLSVCLSIVLAAMHFGAYSFVIPWPIAGAVRLGALWYFARPKVRARPQLSRWRFLAGDGMRLLLARACGTIISQGDYIMLGLFQRPLREPVGVYFFAFNLSMQTVVLFGATFDSILFPTFSKLSADPQRQADAFLVTVRVISLCAIPLCLLQAGLADPVIRLIFAPMWYPSIPIVQILSVGMALRIVGWACQNLLQSQGRFGTYTTFSFVGMLVFLASVAWGANRAPDQAPRGVALAASIYFSAEGIALLILVLRPVKGQIQRALKIVVAPFVLSILSVGIGMLIGSRIPDGRANNVVRILITTLVTAVCYLPAVYILARDPCLDVISRFRRFMPLRHR